MADRVSDLKKMGANRVFLYAVHALFIGRNLEDLHNSEVEEIIVGKKW